MRAVVLDARGRPRLDEIDPPAGETLAVRACGLCGSDVEKLRPEYAGSVLGHEVVAEQDGRRVVLVHHLPCGECERCRGGHESTCEQFGAATIVPGGFAERVRASESVELPAEVDDAIGTYAEPLACALRALERVPRGRVLVVGCGFVGRLFVALLRRRGDDVFARDPNRDRLCAPEPDGNVDTAILCAPGGADDAARLLAPAGTLIVFANAGALPLDEIYRKELTVVGSRSATPRHLREAVALLPDVDLPEPTVLPLARFEEGLELYRSGRALKVVFTP